MGSWVITQSITVVYCWLSMERVFIWRKKNACEKRVIFVKQSTYLLGVSSAEKIIQDLWILTCLERCTCIRIPKEVFQEVPWKKPGTVSKAGLNEVPGLERRVTANSEGSRQAAPAKKGVTVRHRMLRMNRHVWLSRRKTKVLKTSYWQYSNIQTHPSHQTRFLLSFHPLYQFYKTILFTFFL